MIIYRNRTCLMAIIVLVMQATQGRAPRSCSGKRPKVERPLTYPTHDDVVRVVNTEVSTVMMNWMMVFQVFKSFKIFILKLFEFLS